MPVLPIPMIASLILSYLFIHSFIRADRPWFFAALLATCALQGIVISCSQHYGIVFFREIQPTTAILIPPLAWVTFQVTSIRTFDFSRDLQHLIVPVFMTFCVAFAPQIIDLVVPLAFLGYGIAILVVLRSLQNDLPLSRLETGGQPVLIWRVMAIALILSAFSDALILIAQIFGAGWLQAWIISLFSSLTLLLLGALSMSQSLVGVASDEATAETVEATDEEIDIIGMLSALMQTHEPFLEPSLTLNQLSRRMHIPAKQLSIAINRATGGNVSRYINSFRIRRACELLRTGRNVTSAMLESGFNTKSNFNREFLRIETVSPSAWLAKHQGEA